MDNLDILIVEDEIIVAMDLKQSIEELGYKVLDIASTVDEAIEYSKKYNPKLLFMDINLNDSIDGIDCYEIIRKEQDVKVVYLTAYTDDDTINKAINTNPLSYLIKPFTDNRLKAVLKLIVYKLTCTTNYNIRSSENIIKFNDNYYYNKLQDILYFNKYPIKLSKNEHSLLKLLIEARGNPISYSDIQYHICSNNYSISKDSLRALVYRLRAKLEYNFIQTVPSFGYKLIKDC